MARNKKPTVSIIIPTYDRARWLKKSIESVLNQTYQDFELIIVDDSSTDNTPEVVKSFKDKRVRYFQQTKRFPIKSQGAAAARNIGIKKSRGKFIAFNDDDDLWRKRKLEKQITAFEKAGEKTGLVYSKIVRIKGKEKFFIPKEKNVKKEGDVHRDLFLENWIVTLPSALVKKEVFEKIGLFDENFPRYQDWELWLRVSKDYDFKYLPEVLVDSFILTEGIHRSDKALLKATELIFKKHKKEIEKDDEVLAAWQFRLGDLYYHQQKMETARNFFVQALKNSFSFKYCRAIMKTFLGKRISEALIGFKTQLIKDWQLVGILFLALILRLINLNQSLWLDEAVQAITSRGSFLGIFQELKGDFHPPLYHLLIWGWVHLFGSSEIILRLPSVIFGVATVFVVCLIAQEIFPKKGFKLAELSALFLATAPFHIYYSQEARNYALTAFLASLSMYYFIRIVSEQWLVVGKKQDHSLAILPCRQAGSHQSLIGYLLSTTLLLYTNYFGLFILLAQALVALIQRKRKLLLPMLYCLLLFAPDLVLLRTQLLTGRQAVTSLPEWGRLVNLNFIKALPLTFVKFSIGRITIFNKKIYALVAAGLFLIYGGIIRKAISDQYSATRKNKSLVVGHCSLVTIFSWLLIPILCAWLISFFIPNYQPFRLLLVLPAFYLLLNYGISKLSVPMIQIIGTIFILVVNLISLSVYYYKPYFYREDWRGVVQFIEAQPE